MAPTRPGKSSKQSDIKSKKGRAQQSREQQLRAEKRASRIDTVKNHRDKRNAIRDANRKANGTQCGLVALKFTLQGLGFGETEISLFSRQVKAKQLPDITSLSFEQMQALAVDSQLESKSPMLCKALKSVEDHLISLASRITSLRVGDVYELFWVLNGVKRFDADQIDPDSAMQLVEEGILAKEEPQFEEVLKQVVIAAAENEKRSRPELALVFDQIIARYLPRPPTEEEVNSQRCMILLQALRLELKGAHRVEKATCQIHDQNQRDQGIQGIQSHLNQALTLEEHLQELGRPSGLVYAWLEKSSRSGNGKSRAEEYGVDPARMENYRQLHMHVDTVDTDPESDGETSHDTKAKANIQQGEPASKVSSSAAQSMALSSPDQRSEVDNDNIDDETGEKSELSEQSEQSEDINDFMDSDYAEAGVGGTDEHESNEGASAQDGMNGNNASHLFQNLATSSALEEDPDDADDEANDSGSAGKLAPQQRNFGRVRVQGNVGAGRSSTNRRSTQPALQGQNGIRITRPKTAAPTQQPHRHSAFTQKQKLELERLAVEEIGRLELERYLTPQEGAPNLNDIAVGSRWTETDADDPSLPPAGLSSIAVMLAGLPSLDSLIAGSSTSGSSAGPANPSSAPTPTSAVSPATTSPTATSPATTSPATTSPATTSPATTSPATTSPTSSGTTSPSFSPPTTTSSNANTPDDDDDEDDDDDDVDFVLDGPVVPTAKAPKPEDELTDEEKMHSANLFGDNYFY